MADERTRLRMQLGLTPEPTPVKKDAGRKPLTEEQKQTREDQKRAQRESAALAEQLGAKIDPKTGLIDRTTVTTPFNIYGPKGGKTILKQGYRGSGKDRVFFIAYADGSEDITPAPVGSNNAGGDGGGKTVTGTYTDPVTGDVYLVYSDGSRTLQAKGTKIADKTAADAAAQAAADAAKAAADAATKEKRQSAFDILKAEFTKYGLGSLVDTVKGLIMGGTTREEVVLKLRATPEYEKRFAGNKMRLQAGLNVYDEATYLQLENAYDQIFTSYGITEAAGNTAEARRTRYAGFIGGTISPDEIKGRVQLAVAAANEDVVTRNTLRELYPEITEKDIVSYFLNPKEALPKLETKVRSAQIGAAAVRQGLVTNVATAEELAAMGVTEQQAEQAYSAYAGMKPTLDLLSGLEKDNELMVNQQVAEGAFLKNLASEQRKLEMLRQKEIARFSGSAGTNRGALSRETGGLI